MRTFLCVIVAALLSVSMLTDASAKGRRQKPDTKSSTENSEKKKALEADYQKALQSIPESSEKPDPWKNVRSAH